MQDLDHKFTDARDALSIYAKKRAEALASIRTKELRRQARGHAVMASAIGFGKSVDGGALAKIVHGCKLFVIAFAFVLPNLLLIRTVF